MVSPERASRLRSSVCVTGGGQEGDLQLDEQVALGEAVKSRLGHLRLGKFAYIGHGTLRKPI